MQKIVAVAMLLLVCSCGDPDPNYERLKKLDRNTQLSQFEKFSLDERFRLYNKIYRKSGHPHDVELSVGFRDKPRESLIRIIGELRHSDLEDFLRYLPVIYDIGRSDRIDICRPEYIGQLKEIISRYRLTNAQTEALKGLRFGRCELP